MTNVLELFFNTIFSRKANKTEVRQALLDKTSSIFPTIVNDSAIEKPVLMKMFEDQPRWRFCMVQGPLSLELDKDNNICFASKTLIYNRKQAYTQRWILDKDDKTCNAVQQQTWCSQQVEIGPKMTPKGAVIKAAKEKFMNKTEIKSNLPYVAQLFREIFPIEDLRSAIDETAEQELCNLYNISISEDSKGYCLFDKKMLFGKTRDYEMHVLKTKKKGQTCFQMLQQLQLPCSTKDVSDTPEPSLTITPIPTPTPTPPKACTILLEDNTHSYIKVLDSSTSTRPLITKMLSSEFAGRPALIVGTFTQELYVVWNPLSFLIIDLVGVKNHSIPGIVLTCSTFAPYSQFGYSLAVFNQSLVVAAPNATVNNITSAGIIFGIQQLSTFPNATIDICNSAFAQYTLNITNSAGSDAARLGDIVTAGKIYGAEVLAFSEGSLPTQNKVTYVVQTWTQSCSAASIKKTSKGCSGFKGTISSLTAPTKLSTIEISEIDLGRVSKDVFIFIGCADCKYYGSTGAVFAWNIGPNQQSENLGAQGVITHGGLNDTALFALSISTMGNTVFIGAPKDQNNGTLYGYTIVPASNQFRYNPDIKDAGAGKVIVLHPGTRDSSFSALTKIGNWSGVNTLAISSPSFKNNTGKVDVLINPNLKPGDITVSVDNSSFAEKYIQVTSNSTDKPMVGGGMVDFLNFSGHQKLVLSGANSTEAWIFSELSCD